MRAGPHFITGIEPASLDSFRLAGKGARFVPCDCGIIDDTFYFRRLATDDNNS